MEDLDDCCNADCIKNTGTILKIKATLYAKVNLPNSLSLTNRLSKIKALFIEKCAEVEDIKKIKFSLKDEIVFFIEKPRSLKADLLKYLIQ